MAFSFYSFRLWDWGYFANRRFCWGWCWNPVFLWQACRRTGSKSRCAGQRGGGRNRVRWIYESRGGTRMLIVGLTLNFQPNWWTLVRQEIQIGAKGICHFEEDGSWIKKWKKAIVKKAGKDVWRMAGSFRDWFFEFLPDQARKSLQGPNLNCRSRLPWRTKTTRSS